MINSAAQRLYDKLSALDINSLPISINIKRVLMNKLRYLTSSLQLNAYILSWSLARLDVQPNNIDGIRLIDYGGGSGVLSLLAKEMGLSVVYNDIDPVVANDARTLACALGSEADYYIQGDVDDLIEFLNDNKIFADAIASYDVLEHIYDIEAYLKKIALLPGPSLTFAMGSGANIYNARIVRRLTRRHYEAEHFDRTIEEGGPRDCSRSLLEVRREIISEYTDKLTEQEIIILSVRTRGLLRKQILESVDMYLKTGEIVGGTEHPTNTCDPFTGNWCERLMDPYQLSRLLNKEGFEGNVLRGYYGAHPNRLKSLLSSPMNALIHVLNNAGLRIAPYYLIYAKRVVV